jgi:hypothetical protein
MADTTPATQAAPASPTPKPNLYTPRGAPSQFEGGKGGKYDIKNHSYPSDLYDPGGQYGGNYAIFYINVSSESKLLKEEGVQTVADYPPRDQGDMVAMGLTAAQLATAGGVVGIVEGGIAGGLFAGGTKSGVGADGKKTMPPALKGAIAGGGIGAATGAIIGSQGSRSQKRLKTAIALHIPNNLSVNYSMVWSEDDTSALAMAAGAVQQGWEVMKGAGNKGNNTDVSGTGAAILTNIALSKGPNQAGNSVASGLAANPKKEQVFKGVNFRTFTFDYKFFPRNANEARNVRFIIDEFKYHMHPEFKDNNNFVYIYPSEFDIFYYRDGQENLNLHRHTSCVLTDMAINYTPNGMFSTFANGMPTQIDITLTFRELALLTKDKVMDGL